MQVILNYSNICRLGKPTEGPIQVKKWSQSMIATLNDLTTGDHGRITKLDVSNRAYKQQLMAMGLTRGAEFTVMRIAPLGDPIEIKVRGSALSLRKSDTIGVQIETEDR